MTADAPSSRPDDPGGPDRVPRPERAARHPGHAAPDRQPAEARTQADYNSGRYGGSPLPHRHGQDRAGKAEAHPVIRHFHSEFKGQVADLYTDGAHWAATEKDTTSARVGGENVVGEKPDRSPGDTRDLPPSGERLAEMESGQHSRLEMLRRRMESEDVLDGLHDAAENQGNTWQEILAARHPQGHTEQVAPDSPNVSVPVTDHAVAGDIAGAGLMAGIMLFEAGRRLHGMLKHKEEEVE